MAANQLQMSLPSINEMFPEHMMNNWYGDAREAPRDTPLSPEAPSSLNHFAHDNATPRPDAQPGADRRPPSAHHHDPYSRQGSSQLQQALNDPRLESGHMNDLYESRRPYPSPYFSPAASSPSTSPSAYSFDLLRPHPLTADLENVATSHNVALQPRAAHVGYHGPGDRSSAMDPALSHRARPTFRVQVPAEAGRDFAIIPPIQVPTDRQPDYARAYHDSPGYPENPYLSPPITAAGNQSLYRMGQTQASAVPNYEEKKHRCPHCNKRFNRPSSLSIHVNTHTGAKPFQCPYPGCQRRFNVNSNMRRHWRNHLTNSRRRDAVARLVDPAMPEMPPTPPLSASPTDTPRSQYSGGLPSEASSDSTPLPSRSPSPARSYYQESDDDTEMQVDESTSSTRAIRAISASPATRVGGERGAFPFGAGSDPSRDRRRLRSRSSPVPRYREDSGEGAVYSYGHHHQHQHREDGSPAHVPAALTRPRASSCNVPGCECQFVSTILRPAFPSSSMRSAGPPN